MDKPKFENKRVRPIKKVAKCPNCDIELEGSDIQMDSNPPQHLYKCPECGHEFTLYQSYPAIVFEEVN